ncbi:hypothetical protein ROHU_006381 [Labeo rohita]|uniref:Uncharacterized protein n=1 Tax=Labeo rohita TaxID=84645 RepID=A0A498MS54_LABRO|nr:hypothetical protein ROHU_006381 [Labeo rohita]
MSAALGRGLCGTEGGCGGGFGSLCGSVFVCLDAVRLRLSDGTQPCQRCDFLIRDPAGEGRDAKRRLHIRVIPLRCSAGQSQALQTSRRVSSSSPSSSPLLVFITSIC